LPKQIIAKSAAEFAAKTLDVELGKEVGYQYKGAPANAKSNSTRLLYATDGTIVSRLTKDPQLLDFDAVIIDEAHERKVQIDFLLYLLRETIKLRPTFKLIIMSATINSEIFKNYFNGFKYKEIDIGGKRNYPIESIFLKEDIDYNTLLEKGFEILIKILESDDVKSAGSHDIIFFVTSQNEANNICKKLNERVSDEKKNKKCKITCDGDIFCVEVYSGMDGRRQDLAQDKDTYKINTQYVRKVVIATNVAESSLTIDGIKYVIDSGYELKGSYDPKLRAKKLDKQLITQAQAKQRMGRSGRTESGICYHLYTEKTFNNMEKYPQPDIRINDITFDCLKLLGQERINTVDKLLEVLTEFIEPPNETYISSATRLLTQLGAIENNKISKLGMLLLDIPATNVMSALSILFGKIYKCSNEIIKITALLDACRQNLSEVYILPTNIIKDADEKKLEFITNKFTKSREKFRDKDGDHLSLLKIFEKYTKHMNKPEDWAYDNFIKLNLLIKAKNNYMKLKNQTGKIQNLTSDELDLNHYDEIDKLSVNERIIACFVLAYRTNTGALNKDKDSYRLQISSDVRARLNKMSFLLLKNNLPTNIFYNELSITQNKAELNIVSNIPKNIIKILS
jgi:pre-mRNA-splicing factor ATP-dependent RNA helicase DHX15/PRP43